jgi:hypothetical protein
MNFYAAGDLKSSRPSPMEPKMPDAHLPLAKRIKLVSEEIVAPWKSIVMARLKSGWITSYWLLPIASTFEPPDLLIMLPYIR